MTQLWALEFSSKLYFFWVWSHPLETIESSRWIIFSCSYEDTCFVPHIPRRRSYAAIASLNQEKNSQKLDSEMFQVSCKITDTWAFAIWHGSPQKRSNEKLCGHIISTQSDRIRVESQTIFLIDSKVWCLPLTNSFPFNFRIIVPRCWAARLVIQCAEVALLTHSKRPVRNVCS